MIDNAYVIVDYENGTRALLDLGMFHPPPVKLSGNPLLIMPKLSCGTPDAATALA